MNLSLDDIQIKKFGPLLITTCPKSDVYFKKRYIGFHFNLYKVFIFYSRSYFEIEWKGIYGKNSNRR